MRLIEADALMEYTQNQILKSIECNDIARFPAIDAVPVVRCAECKWFDKGGNGVSPICARRGGLAGAHDRAFCSYGEKRDG